MPTSVASSITSRAPTRARHMASTASSTVASGATTCRSCSLASRIASSGSMGPPFGPAGSRPVLATRSKGRSTSGMSTAASTAAAGTRDASRDGSPLAHLRGLARLRDDSPAELAGEAIFRRTEDVMSEDVMSKETNHGATGRTVVVTGVDLSDVSEHLLAKVRDLVRSPQDAELHVVHVVHREPLPQPFADSMYATPVGQPRD